MFAFSPMKNRQILGVMNEFIPMAHKFLNELSPSATSERLSQWPVGPLDVKVSAHSGGLNVVSAVTSPGLYFLGTEVVAENPNEISAARTLCQRIDLTGQAGQPRRPSHPNRHRPRHRQATRR